MTTWTFTGRQSLLSTVARWAAPRLRRSRATIGAGLRLLLRLLLVIAGLGLLSAAAWMIAVPFGLAAAGVSCLLLEWVVKR